MSHINQAIAAHELCNILNNCTNPISGDLFTRTVYVHKILHNSSSDPRATQTPVSLSTATRYLRRSEIPRENEGSDERAEEDADDNVPVVVHG